MLPRPLSSLEIERYFKNKAKFKGFFEKQSTDYCEG